LGDLAIQFILEQEEIITIVIKTKTLIKILEKQNKKEKLKNLIAIEKEDDEEESKQLEELGLKTHNWEEIEQKGKNEGQNFTLNNGKLDDIIYY